MIIVNFPVKLDFEQQRLHPLLILKNLTAKNAYTIIRDQNFGNHLAENGDNFTSLVKKEGIIRTSQRSMVHVTHVLSQQYLTDSLLGGNVVSVTVVLNGPVTPVLVTAAT